MKYKLGTSIDKKWLIREEERVYESRTESILTRKRKRFRLIDVFAGAGGMTLGFTKSFGHVFGVFADLSGYFEPNNMRRGLVPQGSASI